MGHLETVCPGAGADPPSLKLLLTPLGSSSPGLRKERTPARLPTTTWPTVLVTWLLSLLPTWVRRTLPMPSSVKVAHGPGSVLAGAWSQLPGAPYRDLSFSEAKNVAAAKVKVAMPLPA